MTDDCAGNYKCPAGNPIGTWLLPGWLLSWEYSLIKPWKLQKYSLIWSMIKAVHCSALMAGYS